MELFGAGHVTVTCDADEFADLAGCDIGSHADHADRADGDEGERERVVAGDDFESVGDDLAELADALDRATGFFDRDDVRATLGEAGHDVHADVDAAAAGNAVENDRKFGGFCDGAEVAVKALGRGLVVVGGDDEGAVRAGFFGVLGEGDGFVGGIGPGAADNFDPSGGDIDGGLDDVAVFVV